MEDFGEFYEEDFIEIPHAPTSEPVGMSQAQWARQQLQNRSAVAKTTYDAASVAQQARWAKNQLENRKDNTQRTAFDAEAVAKQARSAMMSLANRQESAMPKKFDPQAVSDQAKWAKHQLVETRADGKEKARLQKRPL